MARLTSTPTIRRAPASTAPITHDRPTPPRPITATVDPAGHLGRLDDRADARRHAAADERRDLGRHAVRHRDDRASPGTTWAVAIVPIEQVGEDRGAVGARRGASCRRPARGAATASRSTATGGRAGTRGSGGRARTTTARPPARRTPGSSPGPTASITPAPSCPRTIGPGRSQSPSRTWRSEWQTPDAVIRTRTSPGRGSSSRSVSIGAALARALDDGRLDLAHDPTMPDPVRAASPVFWSPAAMPLIVAPMTVRSARLVGRREVGRRGAARAAPPGRPTARRRRGCGARSSGRASGGRRAAGPGRSPGAAGGSSGRTPPRSCPGSPAPPRPPRGPRSGGTCRGRPWRATAPRCRGPRRRTASAGTGRRAGRGPRGRPRSATASSAVPSPYQPGRLARACDHANTHGIARRRHASTSGALRAAARRPPATRPPAPGRPRPRPEPEPGIRSIGVAAPKNAANPGCSTRDAVGRRARSR